MTAQPIPYRKVRRTLPCRICFIRMTFERRNSFDGSWCFFHPDTECPFSEQMLIYPDCDPYLTTKLEVEPQIH